MSFPPWVVKYWQDPAQPTHVLILKFDIIILSFPPWVVKYWQDLAQPAHVLIKIRPKSVEALIIIRLLTGCCPKQTRAPYLYLCNDRRREIEKKTQNSAAVTVLSPKLHPNQRIALFVHRLATNCTPSIWGMFSSPTVFAEHMLHIFVTVAEYCKDCI